MSTLCHVIVWLPTIMNRICDASMPSLSISISSAYILHDAHYSSMSFHSKHSTTDIIYYITAQGAFTGSIPEQTQYITCSNMTSIIFPCFITQHKLQQIKDVVPTIQAHITHNKMQITLKVHVDKD
jgi:hypothetical protein